MDGVNLLRERRSIRKYKNKKIDRELINDAVQTAIYSPSWANSHPTRFRVIDDVVKKEEFAKKAFNFYNNINIVNQAAGVIVLSYIKGKSGFKPGGGDVITSKGETWGMFDAGIAAQTLSLALFEKGIGSVILGIFEDDEVSKFVSLPENEELVALIPYGYSDIQAKMPPRKDLFEILTYLD